MTKWYIADSNQLTKTFYVGDIWLESADSVATGICLQSWRSHRLLRCCRAAVQLGFPRERQDRDSGRRSDHYAPVDRRGSYTQQLVRLDPPTEFSPDVLAARRMQGSLKILQFASGAGDREADQL
ncbi:MAG: hypothetical protein R3B91_17970 [Planctomycetaceae bacterium]